MKTGALLRFACQAGGILGSATEPQRDALERYGSAVGQAFQIADDLLDLEGDPALVGKSTGKDAVAGKATMVGVLGSAGARAPAERGETTSAPSAWASSAMPYASDWGVSTPVMSRRLPWSNMAAGCTTPAGEGSPETDRWRGA